MLMKHILIYIKNINIVLKKYLRKNLRNSCSCVVERIHKNRAIVHMYFRSKIVKFVPKIYMSSTELYQILFTEALLFT